MVSAAPASATIDPFFAETTMVIVCDVLEPTTGEPYNRDPRGIAKKAEKHLSDQGYDVSYWGPEVEFFVFDKLEVNTLTPYQGQSYHIASREAPWSTDSVGYALRLREGYLPSAPGDTLMEYRNECVDVLTNNFGIVCDAHHHEVATAGQCEIDIRFDSLVNTGDAVQSYKYIVKNVAHRAAGDFALRQRDVALDIRREDDLGHGLWSLGRANVGLNRLFPFAGACCDGPRLFWGWPLR